MEKTLIEELKNRLKEGTVKFTYTKKNGEVRTAEGTTNVGIVAEHEATPAGTGKEKNDTVTCYYDLTSDGWRCFSNENLVSIDD